VAKLLIFSSFAILSFATAVASAARVDPSVPNPSPTLSDKASFDCAKAGSTVAKILCGSHEGATADWDLNATLWAVAGTLTEAQQKSFDQDQNRWRGWLNNKCLQPRPVASDISQEQQRCVINEFHSRAAKLRSKLTGDALAESKLSPEQHAKIQELLISRGLLLSPANGEFGNSTRQAIRNFQSSTGGPQTGYLSSEQISQLRAAQQSPSGWAGSKRQIGNWVIEDKQEPITGRPWVIAQTANADASGMWLQVRCESLSAKQSIPLLVIGLGGGGNNFRNGEFFDGKLRIDDHQEDLEKLTVADSATSSVSTVLTKQVYERVLVARSIGVRIVRADGSEWAFTLKLSETKQALQSLLQACPLESAPESLAQFVADRQAERSANGSAVQPPTISNVPPPEPEKVVAPPSAANKPQSNAESGLEVANVPVTGCDRLAANPSDPDKVAELSGVDFAKIEVDPAIHACEQAVEKFPSVRRFQFQLGRAYFKAKREEARSWFEKAVALNSAAAMQGLGVLYSTGIQGTPKNESEARTWFERGAALNYPPSMAALGEVYRKGYGVPVDYEEARKWYEKAASLNYASAMLSLAGIYHEGRLGPIDYAQERKWLEKAAALGNPSGMTYLANLYHNGLGVPSDYSEARLWYEKAAAQDDALAMYNLGEMSFWGRGSKVNYDEARNWYEKAAALGSAGGMTGLGILYASGKGVPTDFGTARRWFEKATLQNETSAMMNLGHMIELGQGGPRNREEARRWYEKARELGNPNAAKAIAR
jgi:TPR repeat protein/peptidoglycan hydrolase-like protein with peptidoglycan-binding domain/uncharacterized protein YecT (DUF1311 family)